ncbi:hypothetical protein [Neobacillus mesonae]|uniref:hypothetical protein n=1 Tax=Neobacillus mesonae TaxID=1193713 RepID=UPI00203C6B1F|nr:hypothetical protein [Neobacillus mesonae]MCM3570842.1 hypothetical protein [Neobacillus mesonae]
MKRKMRLVGSMEKCWIAREKENMVGSMEKCWIAREKENEAGGVNGEVLDCL